MNTMLFHIKIEKYEEIKYNILKLTNERYKSWLISFYDIYISIYISIFIYYVGVSYS